MAWSCRSHSPPWSQIGQSSGWLISRNSITPSRAFFNLRGFVFASGGSPLGPAGGEGAQRRAGGGWVNQEALPPSCAPFLPRGVLVVARGRPPRGPGGKRGRAKA